VPTLFTTFILAFGDWFRKTASDHVADEGLPHFSAIAQIITITSIKLCISKVRVFSFVFYGTRSSSNNLLYHLLAKCSYIVLKISTLRLFSVTGIGNNYTFYIENGF